MCCLCSLSITCWPLPVPGNVIITASEELVHLVSQPLQHCTLNINQCAYTHCTAYLPASFCSVWDCSPDLFPTAVPPLHPGLTSRSRYCQRGCGGSPPSRWAIYTPLPSHKAARRGKAQLHTRLSHAKVDCTVIRGINQNILTDVNKNT